MVDHLLKTNSTDDILSLGADPIVMTGAGGSVDIFNKLVDKGFSTLQKDKHGMTILHVALKESKEELALYIMKQYPELVHMNGEYGRSALHYAAEGGSVTLLRHFIHIGMDTRCVDKDGVTILHIACWYGRKNAVMYLTQHHEYIIHIKNNNGRTPLHLASVGGNVDIFKHLVTAGLDVHDRDNDMENMLHRACFHRNREMIEYLLQHYTDAMIQPDNDS